jgi:hypothetical protein
VKLSTASIDLTSVQALAGSFEIYSALHAHWPRVKHDQILHFSSFLNNQIKNEFLSSKDII